MQIVIDIPDEQIEKCLEESKYIHENEGEKGFVDITLLYTNKSLEFVDIVRKHDFYSLKANYKILPKGHGRLIDADTYRKEMLYSREFDFFRRLDMQPTIIAADKAESEDKSMTCDKCKYFKVLYDPLRTKGIWNLWDMGRAKCDKHDLITDFANHGKFKRLATCEYFEQRDEQVGNPDRLEMVKHE